MENTDVVKNRFLFAVMNFEDILRFYEELSHGFDGILDFLLI